MADRGPAEVRVQLLPVEGREQQPVFDVVLESLGGEGPHDEAAQAPALVSGFRDDFVEDCGVVHHEHASARGHFVPGVDHGMVDTVGAGDAFLAVLLAGLLAGTPDAALLRATPADASGSMYSACPAVTPSPPVTRKSLITIV